MALTKKQKEVLDFIVLYHEHHGHSPTQNEIKDHFGLKSLGSVQKYLQYLNREGALLTQWNHRRGIEINSNFQKKEESLALSDSNTMLPLLGLVAAGNPILALENPDNYISVPKHFIKGNFNYFALSIKGDSMIEVGILENDIVICKSIENAENGQIVVAIIDGDATLKTYQKKQNQIELHPANHKYKPIVINQQTNNFKIVGVLEGLMRSYS